MDAALERQARSWLADDPDADTRNELSALLDADDEAAVRERFGARLEFGTAGLRGALGAGPARMNRALVRRAAAGLARYLLAEVPGAARAGVVIGHDARTKSDAFAADTAMVLAGSGVRALLLPPLVPTPVLAFAVRHLRCAAGVMVTASHNPATDNGYKVYAGDGGQIAPPIDARISAAIDAVGSLDDVAVAPLEDPLVERVGTRIVDDYVAAVLRLSVVPSARAARIAYTAMHGVGAPVVQRVLRAAGFPEPSLVREQIHPDPTFRTVASPNPEDPGALELALALGRQDAVDVVLANDPDADRLGVAVPDVDAPGGWRPLTGDEIGALLGDHLLRLGTQAGARLVAASVVSSRLLSRIAAHAGVAYAETLPGFKWIARAALDHAGARFVYGYEEALGYAVGDVVRDKDGVSAALLVAEVVATLAADGMTVHDRLEALARRHGLHATRQWSVRLVGVDGATRIAAAVDLLRATPPAALAGVDVVDVEDLREGRRLPPSDAILLRLAGDARVIVRPSGTEPKLKCYFEVVVPVGGDADGYAVARRHALGIDGRGGTIEALRVALATRLGLG